jgi:2-polyprenyl-3-methyl-5-hydroxy-6-metoxy-1,4-benzoquinol methylase
VDISAKTPRFSFAAEEINSASVDADTWLAFVRRREAEMLFSSLGDTKFRSGLELGAGDGGQSTTIARYCEHLTCTELDEQRMVPRDISNVTYRICNAEDLSCFDDASFDLVFASNMIEHLQHYEKCFEECKRVLVDDGIMIFAVPNRVWKIFNNVLCAFACFRPPPLHGAGRGHLQEMIRFGPKRWEKKFRSANLKILKRFKLPFYFGHGNRFLPILKLGNRLGLSASAAFVLGK